MNLLQRLVAAIVGIAVVGVCVVVLIARETDRTATRTIEEALPTIGQVHPSESTPRPGPSASGSAHALTALDLVAVTPPTRAPDYDRELFGDSWEDVDGNGCDTRNDILARDLAVTSTDGTCRVVTGILADVYTGKTIDFVRGEKTSQAVQIDHIVPLSTAWKSGAYAWSEARREQFANDPANLRAVDGPANNSKGDRGPARWLPSNVGGAAFDCQYATDYTSILVKYDLTAPSEDIDALRSTLALCA